jgi:hypothetical protein
MTSQTDRSLPELFGDAMAQLAKLVGNEFALARAELAEKAYLCAGGGAAIVAGALIATGLGRLSGDALKPSITLEQVERDKVAAKEMVR